MTMTLVQTATVGTAVATIDFTSIPQDATDLMIVLSGRTATGTNNVDAIIQFNDVTTGYNNRILQGDGSSVSSQNAANARIGTLPAPNLTANTFGSNYIYVPNYTGSANKAYSSNNAIENNATAYGFNEIIAGLWSNTAAITKITFLIPPSVNFAVGSSASLYKITKGSDGIVTVS
jgi:hypothetical protein